MRRLRAALPQLFRRSCQLAVLFFVVYTAFGGVWRNYKVAHNHRRIVALIEGDTWGRIYGLNEDALALIGDSYETSLAFLGMPWAGRVAGIDSADPLLVASHVLRTGQATPGLALALLVPLILALIAGKVFCSHLCPMRLVFEFGQAVRRGLVRLGVTLPALHHADRFGGWVLMGGLGASMLAGSAVWLMILPYAGLSATIFMMITAGTLSGLAVIVAGWWLIDLAVAPGYFCHNLCPTGFLLEQVGRSSLLRLGKVTGTEPCPTSCHACERTCPYGLSPKLETHRPACDNCGQCVTTCPEQKLRRATSLPRIGALGALAGLALLVLPEPAAAHHNKGMPHYGYFENYPQVPTEEYVEIHGRWEFGATIFNFQGLNRSDADTPNDVKLYLYLYDLEADRGYTGAARFEIIAPNGDLVSSFERAVVDEEAVYSTRETLPRSGDYELVAQLLDEPGGTARLTFYVDLASDRVRWDLIAGITLPVLILFGLAVRGRSRRRVPLEKRPEKPATKSPGAAMGAAFLAMAAALPSAARAEDCHEEATGMVHYATAEGGQVMVMGGIPGWLFVAGCVALIVVSFVAVEYIAPRRREGFRFNLIRRKRVYAIVRSRWFQAIPQLMAVAIFAFLIHAGLTGSRVANITPVAVWTIWWAGLIFAIVLAGPAFCFACPWDGLANLATRLRLAARVEPLSLGLAFPTSLRNLYPAIVLFALLTWLELGWGVTTDPRFTAYMGLGMAALAVGAALAWNGKEFCARACPVGRITGMYSNFSPVEVRARNLKTCERCTTEDCLHGNELGYACPTGISLKTVSDATYCTLCTECVKSCDKHNVAFNLRPFGTDLAQTSKARLDEAWLAIALLALTLFHGFSMTPVWENFEPGGSSLLKWMGLTFGTTRIVSFTIAMAVVLAIPTALYWASCRWASWWTRSEGITTRQLFTQYARALLPIALFYHLAHNSMHLFSEGGTIVPLLSDPYGTGADFFGTRGLHIGPLLGEQSLWYLQVGLILTGHLFGILVAHRIGHQLYNERSTAVRSLAPMLAMMVLISATGLYLMHMDMNMRVGRM